MLSLTRLFQFPTKAGDSNFGKLSAVDISIFPDNTECRPVVTIGLVGSKLAFSTGGEDLLSAVPDSLTMFPYSFTSSLPRVSRVVTASNTKYPATSVVQPLLRAYFGGCRVREVNTAGIFIEDTTGDVCIHNYFNSLWEWVNYISEDRSDRNGMNVNSFRSRYADTVAINLLPGLVVGQVLLMGVVSLYQVMSHKRLCCSLRYGPIAVRTEACKSYIWLKSSIT
ncbi:hypothetical protein PI124_g24434 [Phytophthora idaei]|nr:hypothetical protein PI125_g26852 [Phytophthora idaei]KAG3230468.1 hypothetical protein PI124_g24434 [Phytophthora idaei]